jgi:hypothetical protein
MRALVDRKVTNKITQMNNRLAEFATPVMRNYDLYVYRNFVVSGNEEIKGNSEIHGNLIVDGNEEVKGNVTIDGDEQVKGDVTVNGNINADGYILAQTFLPGQIINLTILGHTQVPYKTSVNNPQFKVLTGAGEQVVFEYNYTPLSSQSNIIIDFNSVYSTQGFNGDSFTGYLYVGNTMVGRSYQYWINQSGGGTRSGTLLPISGKYPNSALTPITISLRILNGSNDSLDIDSDLSTWLKITEVGR